MRTPTQMKSRIISFVLAVGLGAPGAGAKIQPDSNQLSIAFQSYLHPQIDESAIYQIDTLTIEHRDFALHLSSGTLYLLKPILIDSQSLTYGAFYLGPHIFQFAPPLQMEREQIRRFLRTDTLYRSGEASLILFNKSVYERIITGRQSSNLEVNRKTRAKLNDLFDNLVIHEDYSVPFAAFKNLIAPRTKPYLAVLTFADATGSILYAFDPYQREEVSLYKKYREVVVDLFLEKLCQYSIYADSTFERLNGMDKDEIRTVHRELKGDINRGGRYTGTAAVKCAVEMGGTRLLTMALHEELLVDSILDRDGLRVPFLRWTKLNNRSRPLYLFLNWPLVAPDTTSFMFYYHGDIAESKMGVFLVNAGVSWYPWYSYDDISTFDMTFDTPPQYAFVATGERAESLSVAGAMRTRWRIDMPTAFATFNLGTLERYAFPLAGSDSLTIYFNEHQQKQMAIQNSYQSTSLEQEEDTTIAVAEFKGGSFDPKNFAAGLGPAGKDMERQVASDLIGAIALYQSTFGRQSFTRLIATDLTQINSSAYPGFLALSYLTFYNTDPFGAQQLHRAQAAASQWWRVPIRHETYHDQWLSEGFAAYSALLYLQQVGGDDKFLYWLDQYRKDVASLNKYVLKTRQQAGPIILGYRTSTTQSPNDYGLIIYEKGAYVLHMLRGMMLDLNTYSDSALFALLRDFHTTFAGHVANTRDFKAMVEKHIGGDMTWFFNQWVYGNAIPTYKFDYKVKPDSVGRWVAHCVVDQSEVPDGFKMPVPIEIKFKAGGSAWIRQWIDRPHCEFDIPIEGEPSELVFNPMHFVLGNLE